MWTALILGLLQGFLEWLPVSSSGNIILISKLINVNVINTNLYSLSLSLHFGTLLAVLYRFRNEIYSYLNKETFKNLLASLGWGKFSVKNRDKILKINTVKFIFISTLFTGLAGFPIYNFIKNINANFLLPLIGLLLIFTGLVLKFSDREGQREITTSRDMILVGLAQGLAALPGISRSGMTISTLLFRRVNENRSLELSFLISIPAIFGVIILEIITNTLPTLNISFLVATLAAFITSLMMMEILLKIADKFKFWKFCIFFGILTLILTSFFNFLL